MTQNDNAEDILAIAATWKAAGEDVAIATVVETWGSSPRPAGSRLAITKSGKLCPLYPSDAADELKRGDYRRRLHVRRRENCNRDLVTCKYALILT